ncbi:MAG: PrsW family intramembrane metalloprotease [Pirellulales bacterium]|nr:PrsW family intramembrane metalloprotease [Pirellulales bacterium]
MTEWYWRAGEEQRGPISAAELRQLAASGVVRADTEVWKEGLTTWVRASALRGLFPEKVSDIPPPMPEPNATPNLQNDDSTLNRAAEHARREATAIIDDLRTVNFRQEVVPIDASNLQSLLSQTAFWSISLLGVVPLLIMTLEGPYLRLTAFSMFFAAIWGVIFKFAVLPVVGQWSKLIAAFFFTGVPGVVALLFVYEALLPSFYVRLSTSGNTFVSLFGFVLQVGIWEELCKSIPVLAYVWRYGQKVDAPLVMLLGIFSGLGFAAFENAHYGRMFAMQVAGLTEHYGASAAEMGTTEAMTAVMLRSISLVFCHAIWSGMVAYFIAVGALTKRRRAALFLVGIATAAVLHGVYDWLTSVQQTAAALVVFLSYLLFFAYRTKLISMIEEMPDAPSETQANPATVAAAKG